MPPAPDKNFLKHAGFYNLAQAYWHVQWSANDLGSLLSFSQVSPLSDYLYFKSTTRSHQKIVHFAQNFFLPQVYIPVDLQRKKNDSIVSALKLNFSSLFGSLIGCGWSLNIYIATHACRATGERFARSELFKRQEPLNDRSSGLGGGT
ncbi:hypothetical protein CDAR_257941 [Caerostris darwini]|uniref:Uncharacterized protein n=1 Tax=Caerostris darwini TaxID=1538125 RepID=A0AAV4WWG4_9ARAC|nr:hypothetical protein CDAR_257941 [Caerostris darwini]